MNKDDFNTLLDTATTTVTITITVTVHIPDVSKSYASDNSKVLSLLDRKEEGSKTF